MFFRRFLLHFTRKSVQNVCKNVLDGGVDFPWS